MPHFIVKLLICSLVIISSLAAAANEVNIYSARKEALIKPLLDAFTNETGIKVNTITSKADALLTRIVKEADNSPADVLLTTDAGRLHRAKEAGVLSSIESEVLTTLVPSNLTDSDKQWFGLSIRVRPILVNKDYALQANVPSTYLQLANTDYQDQICIRSSSNIYNQSLVAALIAHHGITKTEQWANNLVDNMARKPQGGDRDQIRAAAIGQCGIAIANTYYLAQMLDGRSSDSDQQSAAKINVIWPNQTDTGAHINVSGAGVIRTAPNPENALKLIEFLASDRAQEIYANVNYEYPIRADITLNDTLKQWGEFKADDIDLSKLGKLNIDAVKLMDRAGWR